MASIGKFVKYWRVEVVLATIVLSLGTTTRAQYVAGEWCSDAPIFSYSSEMNLCAGEASDCYACVVWRG